MKHSSLACFLIPLFFLLISCSSDSDESTPDTTSPTISFTIFGISDVSEPIVVSDQMEINIDAKDAGGIAKVEAFIDGQKVGEDTTSPFKIVIDLSGYAAKRATAKSQNYNLRIVATDKSGNHSFQDQLITLVSETPLININFPDEFLNPITTDFYIFASTMEGELLGIEKLESNDSNIVIGTVKDITEDELFMLTFARLNSVGFAELTSISNLSTTLLPEINIGIDQWFELRTDNQIFHATNFVGLPDFVMSIFGILYIGNIDYTDYSTIQIDRYECVNCDYSSSDFLYLSILESDTPTKYLVTDWNIDENFIFSYDDFTDEGLTNSSILIDNSPEPVDFAYLRLVGYFNNVDFNNNFYHLIDDKAVSQLLNDNIPYTFNNIFEKYSYEVTANGYYTNRSGIPLSSIEPLNWNLDYTVSEKTISIEKNGADDILGKIILGIRSDREDYIPYNWAIVFDSQQTSTFKVPEIPEEMKSWPFYEAYANQELQVRQVEIKKYDNLMSYNDYIQKIIAHNKRAFSVSNTIESIFVNSESNFHSTVDDWLID